MTISVMMNAGSLFARNLKQISRFGVLSSYNSNGLRTSSSDVTFVKNKLPKRASPMGLFIKDSYPSLKKDNADKANKDIFNLCIQNYKSLSSENLEKYKVKADKTNEAYKAAKKRLTDKEKETLTLDRKQRIESKRAIVANKNLKKLKLDYNYPTFKGSGISGVTRFAADKQNELKDIKSIKERIRKQSEMWRKLSDSEKKVYLDKASEAMKQRKETIHKWEESMKKKGHAAILVEIKNLASKRRVARMRMHKFEQGIDADEKQQPIVKVGLKTKPKAKMAAKSKKKVVRKKNTSVTGQKKKKTVKKISTKKSSSNDSDSD